MTRKYYYAGASLIIAVLAMTVAAFPYLPSTVASHWDIYGNVDGWSGKWTLLAVDPGIMTAVLLLFAALPWLSPRHFEVDSFRSTSLYLMVVVLAELAYAHALSLAANLSWIVDARRAVEGGFCLLIALLGNVLGKVRRNFFIGVRTPWTLADARVWHATHRLAAKTFFAGGLAGLLAVVLRMPSWLPLALVLTAALVSVVYSLVFYKHLERRGELQSGDTEPEVP